MYIRLPWMLFHENLARQIVKDTFSNYEITNLKNKQELDDVFNKLMH